MKAGGLRRAVTASMLVLAVVGCTNSQITKFLKDVCRGQENCTTYDEDGEPEDKTLRYPGS